MVDEQDEAPLLDDQGPLDPDALAAGLEPTPGLGAPAAADVSGMFQALGGNDAGPLDQSAIDALFASAGTPAAEPVAEPAGGTTMIGAPVAVAAGRGAPERRRGQQVGDLDLLAEVVLTLSAEIGHTEMTINEVLRLRPGSIIELEKLAGEPIDLFIGDRLIARGEVVVVDDNFGVRITELGGEGWS